MEAEVEGADLFVNGCVEDPVQVQPHVLLPVLVGYRDLLPVLLRGRRAEPRGMR